MVCDHVKKLYKYVKQNDLKISAHDILTVECGKCNDKDKCDVIPS
ncbi:MAG: hypothetical protein AABW92_01605 [Nanoarchaeota archaeon]